MTDRKCAFYRLESSLTEAIAHSRGERDLIMRTILRSPFNSMPDAPATCEIETGTMPQIDLLDGASELEKS